MVVSLASVSKRIAVLERTGDAAPVPQSAVEFALHTGLDELDDWQEGLLLSQSPRILLNITRQGG